MSTNKIRDSKMIGKCSQGQASALYGMHNFVFQEILYSNIQRNATSRFLPNKVNI